MKKRKKLLNLACGAKVSHTGDWTNVDQGSPIRGALKMNILDGLDFPDYTFDVVYASHFVEHLDLEQLDNVFKEVFRILKPSGVFRVATPDLEELVSSYMKYLVRLKSNPIQQDEEKYDWIRTELFDQIVRDRSGGEMVDALQKASPEMSIFLSNRLGLAFTGVVGQANIANRVKNGDGIKRNIVDMFKRLPSFIYRMFRGILTSEKTKIGYFRTSGEVHRYIHDSFSLTRAFKKAGFVDSKVVSAFQSDIDDWSSYGLDAKDGIGDGPLCLFMETKKGSVFDA